MEQPVKTCSKCGAERPLADFNGARGSVCSACYRLNKRNYQRVRRGGAQWIVLHKKIAAIAEAEAGPPGTHKMCRSCYNARPLAQFKPDYTAKKPRYSSWCRACCAAWQRAYTARKRGLETT